MAKSYKEVMNDIKAFIFDIDGVLTDGTVHISEDGQLLRQMNIKDGYAMKAALENGYTVCIISGGSNEGVRVRLRNLGITEVPLLILSHFHADHVGGSMMGMNIEGESSPNSGCSQRISASSPQTVLVAGVTIG